MKLIICEGLDNCGKSLLIQNILKSIDTIYHNEAYVKLVHCTTPIGETNEEKWKYQQDTFRELVDEIISYNEEDEFDFVICDRFIEGEYVHGQIYRNENPQEILSFIHEQEKKLIKSIKNTNILYISLTADVDFLVKHDDGKSLGEGSRDKIFEEIQKFLKIYGDTKFKNKKYINVNDEFGYRSEEVILQESIQGFKFKDK